MTNEEINALTDKQINVMMTFAVNELAEPWQQTMSGKFVVYRSADEEEKPAFVVKDYCNDPAAMMPLAFENKIMFNPYRNDGEWMCEAPIDFKGISTVFAGVSIHKKPLRAAAIAYLKSKGVL